jgi:hypothetical protein
MMKIFLIGGGGREHTLAWKIKQSPKVEKIFCAPGNAGIEQVAECIQIPSDDIDELARFAKKEQIDLTVVGPELNDQDRRFVSLQERRQAGKSAGCGVARLAGVDHLMRIPAVGDALLQQRDPAARARESVAGAQAVTQHQNHRRVGRSAEGGQQQTREK